MTAQLNHTIVWCRDKDESSAFLTEVLGLSPATTFGPFRVVELDNGVSLDYHDTSGDIASQHYAFLIGEDDFDRVLERLAARGVGHWADPGQRRPGEINRDDGGRGMYFEDPDGHVLEVITRPYGSGG